VNVKTTVKEIKERLHRELDELLSNLPGDDTVVDFNEAVGQDRCEDASLLEDIVSIVPSLRHYYPQEKVTDILGGQDGLRMLLSKWRHRIGFIVQNYID
jgi:hypothetical protein